MDNKFKIFVIVAIVVLALSIGLSTFFILSRLGKTNDEVDNTPVEYTPILTELSVGDSIMTNIAKGKGESQHFIKVKISLGVDSTDSKAYTAFTTVATSRAATIRSEIISVLGEQSYDTLSSEAGKSILADAIIIRLNTLLETDLIYKVYYEEYFVQ